MSIPVALDKLAASMKDYPTAFLITVNDDRRAHVVQVQPSLVDGALRIGETGRRTSANLDAHPQVTVLFPPHEPGGYALLVDGVAERGGGEAATVSLTPSAAVLHRAAQQQPASDADPGACVNDCIPLDDRHG